MTSEVEYGLPDYEPVKMSRANRTALIREVHRWRAEHDNPWHDDIATHIQNLLMERVERYGWDDADPMAVSDYAYGLARFIDPQG